MTAEIVRAFMLHTGITETGDVDESAEVTARIRFTFEACESGHYHLTGDAMGVSNSRAEMAMIEDVISSAFKGHGWTYEVASDDDVKGMNAEKQLVEMVLNRNVVGVPDIADGYPGQYL